jgi:uncharacterized protein YueI
MEKSKSLNVKRHENNIVNIRVCVELCDKKTKLEINDKTAEKKFNKIFEKVKIFSKFQKLSLNYNTQNFYINHTNIYTTPHIIFEKNENENPIIMHCEHNCTSKKWEECFELSLNNPKTIKPIEIFFNQFDIFLNNKELKEIRKAIKGDNIYYQNFKIMKN